MKTIVYLTGAVDNHVSEGEDSIVIHSLPYRCMLVKPVAFLTGANDDHGEHFTADLMEAESDMCLRMKTIVYLIGANNDHVFPGEDYIAYLTRGDDGHCNLPCRS